jgi:arylsulfatase
MRRMSRRQFSLLSAGALAAPLAGCGTTGSPAVPAAPAAAGLKAGEGGYNILFVFADQERFFPKWPAGFSLPAHERMQRTGTRFLNHYTSSTMCTSSRAVIMTGLQVPDHKMYENCDVPYVQNLSTKIPTIGHMLRKAGYYTAYKGKWHLTKEFDQKAAVDRLFTTEMEAYGFSDYASPGDVVGHTQGGYQFDHLIAGSVITWLRRKGSVLSEQGKPWSLAVSLVNPHDVMYFNTDKPGEHVQDNGRLLSHAARAPRNELYRATWDHPIAPTFRQPLDAPGRPRAHAEFVKLWDQVLGRIPPEEERWRRFTDYYLNCIRAVDLQLTSILNELDVLGLAEKTIIVYTADHGEMAGAHGMRGKGPMAYEEGIHVPLYIVHPDVKGGQDCKAVTSNIDLAPTFLGMAGVSAAKAGEFAGRALPGKNLSPVLNNPAAAAPNAVREGALFAYCSLATTDSALIGEVIKAAAAGKNPREEMKASGFKPDLRKRGNVRALADGRYKFTRFFAPLDHNKPGTIDELFKANDVELYDLQADPHETANLSLDREKNKDLILAMNTKLENVIKAEIGVDDGRELPELPGINWALDRMD